MIALRLPTLRPRASAEGGGGLKFLFVGPGYPGVPGAANGSGIGTYVRELALGLTARGHRCHVLAWSENGAFAEHCVEGVTVHLVPPAYWRGIERFWPDSRKMWTRGRAAAQLDRCHHFNWIEIQSDEGIDLAVQRRFHERVIMRVHTTLAQMCRIKGVVPNRLTPHYAERERRSFRLADRIIASSDLHARELEKLFPELPAAEIVPLGCGRAEFIDPGREFSSETGPARFLVVGTFDQRKGTDRLRDVAGRYASLHGSCELRLVSSTPRAALAAQFDLADPCPPGVSVRYLTNLAPQELEQEYRQATAYLHLARYESFGYPLIEAAAVGTPVIATATGIASELLEGDLQPLLVNGDDPADCVRALRLAVVERAILGARVFEAYANRFTRDHMTERYLNVLTRWQRAGAERLSVEWVRHPAEAVR